MAHDPEDFDTYVRGEGPPSGAADDGPTRADPFPVRGDTAPSADGPVCDEVPVVAGYTLERLLGEGGMGEVWLALEHRFERWVALKIARGAFAYGNPGNEARLAARIAHPGVVPVHDFGHAADGRAFYTMDLVEGTELRALVCQGAVPARRACGLAIEIAEAVDAAHKRGVVHCDLKPDNIMVDAADRIRILDFGLAGVLIGADRGRLEAGTPPYMAPEQVAGEPVGTGADIWALGVVLFEMVTGTLPFPPDDHHQLMDAILRGETPCVLDRVASAALLPELDAIIQRCLMKDPADRYPTTRALVEHLRAVHEGRAPPEAANDVYEPRLQALAAPPPPPPRADPNAQHYAWTFELESPPSALWPLVAHTERFNKAMGLPDVLFEEAPAKGDQMRVGRMRVMGMQLAWDEHPFEWVHERVHSVYRDYAQGPLSGLWNCVTLEPLPSGGTRLTHAIWAVPRGTIGRVAGLVELRMKFGNRARVVYPRLDRFAAGAAGPAEDPFEDPHAPSQSQRELIARGVQTLVLRGFERVAEPLGALLLSAPDKAIERLRPYELARRWQTDRDETLDAFLHAVEIGLLEHAWDLVCPVCMVPHESASSLGDICSDASCAACRTEYQCDLATSIELTFRPSAAVRPVTAKTYCVGAPAMRPHVLAQQVMEPGTDKTIELQLAPGSYRVTGPGLGSAELIVTPAGHSRTLDVVVQPDPGSDRGGSGIALLPSVVCAGGVSLRITHRGGHRRVVRLEKSEPRSDAVRAVAAVNHATFQEFFPGEAVAPGQELAVRSLSFVLLDAQLGTETFAEGGDRAALSVLQRIEEAFEHEVRRHRGAVVPPTSVASSVGAFARRVDAANASLRVAKRLQELGLDDLVRLSAIEGPCIAVRRGGRIGYFGETLMMGRALLRDGGPRTTVFPSHLADDPDVARVLSAPQISTQLTVSGDARYGGRRIVRAEPAA